MTRQYHFPGIPLPRYHFRGTTSANTTSADYHFRGLPLPRYHFREHHFRDTTSAVYHFRGPTSAVPLPRLQFHSLGQKAKKEVENCMAPSMDGLLYGTLPASCLGNSFFGNPNTPSDPHLWHLWNASTLAVYYWLAGIPGSNPVRPGVPRWCSWLGLMAGMPAAHLWPGLPGLCSWPDWYSWMVI